MMLRGCSGRCCEFRSGKARRPGMTATGRGSGRPRLPAATRSPVRILVTMSNNTRPRTSQPAADAKPSSSCAPNQRRPILRYIIYIIEFQVLYLSQMPGVCGGEGVKSQSFPKGAI
jgi:hypothetical protein